MSEISSRSLPLEGRVVLLTGLTRSVGIGYAIARRLIADGAMLFATGWEPHDAEMSWGVDPAPLGEFPADRFHYVQADLADPAVPGQLIDATIDRFGAIDCVVADHARSSTGSLADVSVEELDLCWQINTRGSLLLARALSEKRGDPRPGGRLVFFTSGQADWPMWNEIAYSLSKGAILSMTNSVSDFLIDLGITTNCINPGPVDTGYARGDAHEEVRLGFPAGRWGEPDDVANLVAWLLTDDAAWITGQLINSTGGWRGSRVVGDMDTRFDN
jgi:3-oxoacyl-[acyl-carrier protein] reductase